MRRYPEGSLYGHPIGYSFVQEGDTEFEQFHNDELVGNESEFSSILDELRGRARKATTSSPTSTPRRSGSRSATSRKPASAPSSRSSRRPARVQGDGLQPPFDPNRVPYELEKLNKNETETPLLNRATQGRTRRARPSRW